MSRTNPNVIPNVVSGHKESIKPSRLSSARRSADVNPELRSVVVERTPSFGLDTATAPIAERGGTTLGLYYINPPRIDTHIYRALARRILADARAFSLAHNGFTFWEAYPDLAFDPRPGSVRDDEAQTQALVHVIREFDDATVNLICAMANHRAWSTIGSDSPYSRISNALKWMVFNNRTTFVNGTPVSGFLLNYILENTRVLTGKQMSGGAAGAYPVWRIDTRGYTARWMHEDNEDDDAVGDADQPFILARIGTALQAYMLPNDYVEPDGVTLAGITHLLDGLTTADGYIPHWIWAGINTTLTALQNTQLWGPLHEHDSAVGKYLRGVLGLFDATIDNSKIDKAVRDNAVGDIDAFAAAHMVYQTALGATMRMDHRGVAHFDANYPEEFDGVYLGSDSGYANHLIHRTGVDPAIPDGANNYAEPFLASIQAYDNWLLAVPFGEFFANFSGDFEPMLNQVDPTDHIARIMPSVVADADWSIVGAPVIEYNGVDGESIKGILGHGLSELHKPFIIRDEWAAGLRVIRSPVTPLIDRHDPTQCGFYVVCSTDAGGAINPWEQYVLKSKVGTLSDTIFNANEANWKDRIAFVGDALLLGPNFGQSRSDVGQLVTRITASGEEDPVDVCLVNNPGCWLVKPYTVETPMGLVPFTQKVAPTDRNGFIIQYPAGTTVEDLAAGAYSLEGGQIFERGLSWIWFAKSIINEDAENALKMRAFQQLPTFAVIQPWFDFFLTKEQIEAMNITGMRSIAFDAGSSSLDETIAGAVHQLPREKFGQSGRSNERSNTRSYGGSKGRGGKRKKSFSRVSPIVKPEEMTPPAIAPGAGTEQLGAVKDETPLFSK